MEKTWWKEGVVYQIYPRSFQDSNGDGVGDLRGILRRLDYIASLGVDIVWLNPVYSSPNKDNGYDISDYRNIMAEFGTLQDFDELLAGLHARGIRLIMDLVVNHSSNEHEWFRQARTSKDNPFHDYYIWKNKPNNWPACFGGSAWELNPATGEYYLHLFAPEQPDLNWENPALRTQIYDMMHWWFKRGIDGFRMDVITMLSKHPSYRDLLPGETPHGATVPYIHGPRIHEFLREMHEQVLSRYDCVTVGESPGLTPEIALDYVGDHRGELDMAFHFELNGLDAADGVKWNRRPIDLRDFKRITTQWQTALHQKGWNSVYLMNHDQPRAVSRYGNDGEHRVSAAKMLILHLMTLQGTPYLYQGEEIGMTNVAFGSIDDYRDVEILNFYQAGVAAGQDPQKLLQAIHYAGRDNARTPMQWGPEALGGFTTGRPWIPLNPNFTAINVEQAEADRTSILHFTRAMIAFRKAHPSLVYGDFELLEAEHAALFAYVRRGEGQIFVVLLNFSSTPVEVTPLVVQQQQRLKAALNTAVSTAGPSTPGASPLGPWEGRVLGVTIP